MSDWATASIVTGNKKMRVPDLTSVREHFRETTTPRANIRVRDLHGSWGDIQGFNWERLGVTRAEARKERKRTYKNYTTLRMRNVSLNPPRPVDSSRLILASDNLMSASSCRWVGTSSSSAAWTSNTGRA